MKPVQPVVANGKHSSMLGHKFPAPRPLGVMVVHMAQPPLFLVKEVNGRYGH